MKRLSVCVSALLILVSALSAQTGAPRARNPREASVTARSVVSPSAKAAMPALESRTPDTFQFYCYECHSGARPAAGLSLEKLVGQGAVGLHPDEWEKVADMLETEAMPPLDARDFPTNAERAASVQWIRSSLKTYETAHAGEPGHVTVRRLTSGEYAYAIKDLTGADIATGIDASSDSVGGEGFANFGDVQFVEDARIERYLEAAKTVADHAMIGAGPLEFSENSGPTGLELFALRRINALHEARGFRVVSGEGGRPFGLDRYGKAFYATWAYQHRVALGMPSATLTSLAEQEGITGTFAQHIWSVVHLPQAGYPVRDTVDSWKRLPAPTADRDASIAAARAACDALYKTLTTWPSWFFARGDIAAGGAGDESPLVFTDTSLKAEPTHHYSYLAGPRAARGRGAAPTTGPVKVYLAFTNVNPDVPATVIWRNARVVTRAPAPARGAAPPAGTVVARGGQAPLSTQPLRTALPAASAAALHFGTSPDGTPLGPDDFATTSAVSFDLDVPAGGNTITFEADVELGHDRNAVVRLMVTDRPEGSNRDAAQRVILGEPASLGYRTFRAGIAQYVALLPPNSHGEANPADKDPVPLPFDSTFNTPEHDAFVIKVKYQRNDTFLAQTLVTPAERRQLDQAWTTLLTSFDYYDNYLGMLADHYGVTLASPHIKALTPARIAALPEEMRQYVRPLKLEYDRVTAATTAAEPAQIDDALALASRAWRRPLTPAERVTLRGFYERSRTISHLDHDGALRALIARILVSPSFLYRVESVGSGPERPLNGYEMASRLSFFLWSSVPDAELRRAAAAGELSDATHLSQQVRRMTADPKARRVATEFFGQWLGYYHFDQYRGVDTARFPEFTDEVKASMYDEAVSTLEYIVRQNRPIREMLYADYTFLNKPLAKFYGLDVPVTSPDVMVKVSGAGRFDRGGVLRLGTTLTTTSAPLRTSPVKRGDWVLRRILGTPTPPPPPDAGSIPADDKTFNGLSLREKLAQHKRNATCANCHLRIDPLGFPLEGFDAVGRSRATYTDGKPVDATGEFADKSTISGSGGLLEYLRSRDPLVMKTLSRKMLGYALGRTVLASDQPLIKDMMNAGPDVSFADLAVRIVTSRQFRNHQGPDEDTAAPAVPATAVARNTPPTSKAGLP